MLKDYYDLLLRKDETKDEAPLEKVNVNDNLQ